MPQTIASLRTAFQSGETTPREVVEQLIAKIESEDGDIGAFLGVDAESALAAADSADLSKPLGGVPIALKDNLNVKGQPCTCGSKFLEEGYVAPYDATVVQKLRDAGAIILGRLNMDEFAMGSATENSALKKTHNPHDLSRIPGGSSGGSAAAVAAETAIATLGSDTGGSIRQPASHCGVVGLKPTYGLVSRFGLVAFASSLDQIGPLAHTVEDTALLLNVIAGHDQLDSTSANREPEDYTAGLGDGVKGLKVGLPKEYFSDSTSPAVRAAIELCAEKLKHEGAEIIDVSLPHTEYAVATYYIIAPAEASSNLSRFDGIRYGKRATGQDTIESLNRESREAGFGPEVQRRIILGTYVLSGGYYDAYYSRAQKVRTLIRKDFEDVFKKVDVLLTPTAPTVARKAGENEDDPLAEYLADIFTIPANLAGIPAISVPVATEEKDGKPLPIGAQLMAPHWEESRLLRTAKVLEDLKESR